MKCVVPLAGPDIWTPEYGLRVLYEYEGRPILSRALDSRPWAGRLSPSDYIFVVRDIKAAPELYEYLNSNWPGCLIVKIPHLTGGAMLSALSGVSLVNDEEPIIIDLADILFTTAFEIPIFGGGLGAIVPVFESDEDCYSYLVEQDGLVVSASEKVVTSKNASAGVYIFKDRATFVSAAGYSLKFAKLVTYKGLFFVCPMVNGVIDAGLKVIAPKVGSVVPVSKAFHTISRAVGCSFGEP